MSDNRKDRVVYRTGKPDVYHFFKSCYHIRTRSNVKIVSVSEAERAKLRECEDCQKKLAEE